MGLVGLHHPRSQTLPSHGTHHCPDLQLVVPFCSLGDSGKTRRGHYQPPTIAERRRQANDSRRTNHSHRHQHARQSSSDARCSSIHQFVLGDCSQRCGAVDLSSKMAPHFEPGFFPFPQGPTTQPAAIHPRVGLATAGSRMKQFEAELLKEDWKQVRPEVEVKKVSIPQGEETYILCRTSGRKEKEKAI